MGFRLRISGEETGLELGAFTGLERVDISGAVAEVADGDRAGGRHVRAADFLHRGSYAGGDVTVGCVPGVEVLCYPR